MSISKPYDVANYPNAKAIVAVYGNKGNGSNRVSEAGQCLRPQYPSRCGSHFQWSKSCWEVTSKMCRSSRTVSCPRQRWPIYRAWSLYTDPVKDIKVNIPSSAQLDQPFTATVTLEWTKRFRKNDYRLALKMDTQHLTSLPSQDYTISGDTVLISQKPMIPIRLRSA